MSKVTVLPHAITLSLEEKSVGAFSNINLADYHGDRLAYAYSKSDLDALSISPGNLIQKRAAPKSESPTKALRIGKLVHAMLEYHDQPEKFKSLYQKAHKGTKKEDIEIKAQQNKDAYENGLTLCDADELETAEQKYQQALAHPEVREIMNHRGVNEQTFIWQDKDTGIYCKCRPDRRLLEPIRGLPNNIVVDYKTIATPFKNKSLKAIEDAIEERRYHVQAAFYSDGIKEVLGIEPGFFGNIFIETGEISNVICTKISDEKIKEGREIYKRELKQLADCLKTNTWDGWVTVGKVWKL